MSGSVSGEGSGDAVSLLAGKSGKRRKPGKGERDEDYRAWGRR